MKGVLSIKIDRSLIQKIRDFCESHGLKQGFFVEKAIREQLDKEEMVEDIVELKELRSQEKDAIHFSEYLKKRNS